MGFGSNMQFDNSWLNNTEKKTFCCKYFGRKSLVENCVANKPCRWRYCFCHISKSCFAVQSTYEKKSNKFILYTHDCDSMLFISHTKHIYTKKAPVAPEDDAHEVFTNHISKPGHVRNKKGPHPNRIFFHMGKLPSPFPPVCEFRTNWIFYPSEEASTV